MSVLRGLLVTLMAALLASCMAHGQGKKIDPKVHVNYTPYGEVFYRELMTGRVNLYVGTGRFRNIVQGQIFGSDGTVIECSARLRLDKKIHWIGQSSTRWALVRQAGARVEWNYGGGIKKFASKFYDPATGEFSTEVLAKGRYFRTNPGVIQDSWPRALADACPSLKVPAHIGINEKQTSLKMDELRQQDPDAPIRNFPGSEMTAPGRTGLGASGGRPTTTQEEILAFVRAQDGNIMQSGQGDGYIFVGGRAVSSDSIWTDEVWKLDDEGRLEAYGVADTETDASGQDWVVTKIPGQPEVRYPVGYPFPLLPTGYRHAAFQLTDRLIESGDPVVLPWMPEKWKDFVFRAEGTVYARSAGEGYDRIAPWRWTKGRLHVWIDGNREAPEWTEVADMLGMEHPKLWTVWDSNPERPRPKARRGPLERDPDGRRPCSKYPAPCYGN